MQQERHARLLQGEISTHNYLYNMPSAQVQRPNGSKAKPYIIGVVGGTNSGKSSVCKKIITELNNLGAMSIVAISQDSFYRDLEPEDLELAHKSEYNFDHPKSIDDSAIYELLIDLCEGRPGKIPIYDFKTHRSTGEFEPVQPAEVILLEGIMLFYYKKIREICDMKLYIDCDADTRLARRVRRDTAERGRTIDSIIKQYTSFVKPSYDEFCAPTKKYADVIVPRGVENEVAINLIICHIQDILKQSGEIFENGAQTVNGDSDQKRPH